MSSELADSLLDTGGSGGTVAGGETVDESVDGTTLSVKFGVERGIVVDEDGSVCINGSILEGGGQILRNSMALASLLGLNIKITKIRDGRPKPGLKAQHLTGIRGVAEMYSGVLLGAAIDSMDIEYKPKLFRPGRYLVDIQTAGSIALVIQACLPAMLYGDAPSQLKIIGGTNVSMSPQIDYLTKVFQPMVQPMGVNFTIEIAKRGYFPKGGGEVTLRVPAIIRPDFKLKPIMMVKRGSIVNVHIWVYYGGKMPRHVADRLLTGARTALMDGLVSRGLSLVGVTSDVEDCGPARDSCAGCIIIATTSKGYLIAGTSLLERNQQPQDCGVVAAAELLSNIDHGGCVDEYLQDQLIIFMALAAGPSAVLTGPLTMHTKSSIYVASHLTGAVFTCAETGRGTVMIRCTGIGHTRRTVAHTTGTSSGSVESGGGTGSGGPSLIDASFGDSTK